MILRNALLGATALLTLPAAVLAQTTDQTVAGPYVGGALGWTWTEDMSFEFGPDENEISFADGYTGVLEAGYRLGTGLRAGLELGWSSSTVDDIAGGPTGRSGGAGSVDAFTAMGAVYYELNPVSAFRPYIGIGAGIADITFDGVGELGGPGQMVDNNDDRTVAWQIGAGVSYAVSPNLDLTVGYRFLDTGMVRLRNSANTEFEFDYQSHSVLVDLRYTFGAAPAAPAPVPAAAPAAEPPAPPPPPPPPAISRNFTVFFDWNRADLTGDAEQVLRNVARDAQGGNISVVQITGHADTSGSADYNERLSQRRAEAVRSFLVGQGISADQVEVRAAGETELLVPTPDGVREPSNRRAVIIFP